MFSAIKRTERREEGNAGGVVLGVGDEDVKGAVAVRL
jgi:hypothetical protein